MFTLISMALCFLIAASGFTAVRSLGIRLPASRGARIRWLGLTALALILLGRPDEQVEAGQDPGAYFNATFHLMRENRFHFPDPALVEVDAKERKLFRYGHDGFHHTKDSVLWSKDDSFSKVGIFFFPAYSLLLILPAALGWPYGMFIMTSLMVIGSGLMLAALARRCIPLPGAGLGSFFLYLFHPAIAWNGRALRAEWPAAYLLLAGTLLWVSRREERLPSRLQGLLSGLALGMAVLFHPTALYVVIPMFAASTLLASRERFWFGWFFGLSFPIALWVAQTCWVTDPYFLTRTLAQFDRRALALGAMGVGTAGVMVSRYLLKTYPPSPRLIRFAGVAFALAVCLLVLFAWGFRDEKGRLPGLPAWTTAYLSLTDFRGVAGLMTPAWFVIAILGWIPLAARSGMGRWVFWILSPAAMTIGWVNDYMFETRRMVAVLTPLLVLGTLALFAEVLRRLSPRSIRRLSTLCLLPVTLAVTMHPQLYTIWNLRGGYRFYADIAEQIKAEADILFAEYTQTSVPVSSLSGLPLLPISWDYRSDAEILQAQEIMSQRVMQHPDTRHVLLSPFQAPLLPGVGWEPLLTSELETQLLGHATNSPPKKRKLRKRGMYASRLLPPSTLAPRIPYVRHFQGSKLGIQGGSNPMTGRDLTIRGRSLRDGFTLPAGEVKRWVFWLAHAEEAWITSVSTTDTQVIQVDDTWTYMNTPPVLSLPAGSDTYLVEAYRVLDGVWSPIEFDRPDAVRIQLFDSQWLLPNASLALPMHRGSSCLWIFASSNRQEHAEVAVTESTNTLGNITIAPEWRWIPLHLDLDENRKGTAAWVKMKTSNPHRPDIRGFPNTLGFRLGTVMVLPDPNFLQSEP